MPLIIAKLMSGDTKAKLDTAIAAYKAGAGTELSTSQRAMASDSIVEADGDFRSFVLLAHGGLDVPGAKTADMQHVVVKADGSVSRLQTAISAALADVLHATDATGDTTVAGKVTVTSATFFASEDVGRKITVNDVEKTITSIGDNSVAASGGLTTIKGSLLVDGETFVLDDGVNAAVTFEFDDDSSVVETATLRAVDFVAGVAAAGSLTALAKAGLDDGDNFVLDDGVNAAVEFSFVENAAVAAAGSLTALAKASLADGDIFTLDDGVNAATTFEFDVTGTNTPAPGNIEIDISALTTNIEVADAMRTAITGAATLDITPDAPGAALINLVNDAAGTAGNVAITETLASGTLTPVGMLGGTDEWTPGGGWDATHVKVDIIAAVTDINVADAMRTAITGAATLDITPDAPGAALINLVNDTEGVVGNVAITETLAVGTLTPVGMLGGVDGDSADDMRDAIITAVTNAPALDITATDGGAATVDLVNDLGGVAGNVAIVETVVNPGFVATGMSGGVDATTTSAFYTGTALAAGTGKTVKLFGAEVLQKLHMNVNLDRDRDFKIHVVMACEGQVA